MNIDAPKTTLSVNFAVLGKEFAVDLKCDESSLEKFVEALMKGRSPRETVDAPTDAGATLMLVATDDEGRARITYCHNEGELEIAVGRHLYINGAQTDDQRSTAHAHATILLEDGEATFEGDPNMFLYRLARPAPLATTPHGWKLVPVHATGYMKDAGHGSLPAGCGGPWTANAVYQAMIDNAPTPPLAFNAPATEVEPDIEGCDELRHAVQMIGVVGHIDGHPVIRRSSVLDIINQHKLRRASADGQERA
ncbi:hypothetical protein [Paraburkholderia sp. J10-1]|uniref:hypothetical protein n=1 Tax=Paraburkholderia sp. J10-1 TaxID=2805430 RepID=UPI002AB74D1C|nr:hypothetical protein [Paraburkholderia sp. J10-1]